MMSLIEAAKNDNVNKVRKLLATNAADVYETGYAGGTPLMCASTLGHKDIVKMLLKYDDSPEHINCQSTDKITALMCASWGGYKEIVEMLLKYDNTFEHVNQQDGSGWTALMHASRCGNKKIVEILLERDANVDILDVYNKSAIDLAKTEEIKELLLNWEPKGVKRAKGV